MKLKHLQQPPGSSLCGQTCVAMLLGVELGQSIEEFKSRGGTRTKQIKAILEKHGYVCADRLKLISKKKPQFPDVCICRVRWGHKSRSHWVLKYYDKLYDPECPDVRVIDWNSRFIYDGMWVSSYLEIKRAS